MPCLAPCLPCATLPWHPSFPMLVQSWRGWGPSLWSGLLLHPLLGTPSTVGAALLTCWAWEGGSCACRGMQECVSHQSPISRSPSGLMCLLFWSIPLRARCLCCGTAPNAPALVWVLTPKSHAERSGRCQALPADVIGMIRLAEQGMQLHRTVQ